VGREKGCEGGEKEVRKFTIAAAQETERLYLSNVASRH
jgi:hypothetical protein